jgi:hypothetical protein
MKRASRLSLLVVLAALFACKSKGTIAGSVTLDGAPFKVVDCSVGESTFSTGGESMTTHSVLLVDASKRRLTFSDSQGMRVSLASSLGALPNEVGEGCGHMTVTGSVKSSVSSVTGRVDANCTGGGHVVKAAFGFSGCGSYGLGVP